MYYRNLIIVMTVFWVSLYGCVPIEETRSDSEEAKYHYLLGVTALNEQNPTEALKEFLKAEEFNDDDPEIQAGLAQAYWLKKAYDLAEKHFLNALKLSDDDPKYYNNLGALYLSLERYDDSINAFEKAAENLLFDRPELAWTGIGLANFNKQDYAAAERAYKKALDYNPRYYRPAFHLGELYYNQNRPVEALGMFSKSVELAPEFYTGYYWKGLVYMQMKEPQNAKKEFEEVVRLAPKTELSTLSLNYLKIINE